MVIAQKCAPPSLIPSLPTPSNPTTSKARTMEVSKEKRKSDKDVHILQSSVSVSVPRCRKPQHDERRLSAISHPQSFLLPLSRAASSYPSKKLAEREDPPRTRERRSISRIFRDAHLMIVQLHVSARSGGSLVECSRVFRSKDVCSSVTASADAKGVFEAGGSIRWGQRQRF